MGPTLRQSTSRYPTSQVGVLTRPAYAAVIRSLCVRLSAVVIVLAMAFVGCSPTAPTVTTSAPFSQSDIVVGGGAVAANGSVLTVGYTGWLFDNALPNAQGAQFDTSTA